MIIILSFFPYFFTVLEGRGGSVMVVDLLVYHGMRDGKWMYRVSRWDLLWGWMGGNLDRDLEIFGWGFRYRHPDLWTCYYYLSIGAGLPLRCP
jgi:hypothetical protein